MIVGKRLWTIRQKGGAFPRRRSTRRWISRVEHGYTVPSLDTLERFADALDVVHKLFVAEAGRPETPQLRPSRSLGEQADDKRPAHALDVFKVLLEGSTAEWGQAARTMVRPPQRNGHAPENADTAR